jgi:hypothetical protein
MDHLQDIGGDVRGSPNHNGTFEVGDTSDLTPRKRSKQGIKVDDEWKRFMMRFAPTAGLSADGCSFDYFGA